MRNIFIFLFLIVLSGVSIAEVLHKEVIQQYKCSFDSSSPEARMMVSYLTEKNALDQLDKNSPSYNLRITRLVDLFVKPSYLKEFRLLPGSAKFNTYGSAPENLICITRNKEGSSVLTSISNEKNKWTNILQYTINSEAGQPYISPIGSPRPVNPFPSELSMLNKESDPIFWIDPHILKVVK